MNENIIKQKKSIGFGIASLVTGILSTLTGMFFYFSIPFGILGIVFYALQNKRCKTGLAKAGLVTSIVGVSFGALWGFITLLVLSFSTMI